jgi:hypothetical protein
MAKDGPVPGDDGYTAGNAAWDAYGAWGDVSTDDQSIQMLARDQFLRQASVFLEGWCGGA